MNLHLELSKKAYNNILQFKDHATDSQFNTIAKAIEGHDINLQGSKGLGLLARMKLEAIAELDLPNFIDTLKYIN